MKPFQVQNELLAPASFQFALSLENWKTHKAFHEQMKMCLREKLQATCKIVRENTRCNDPSVAVENRF